MLPHTGAVLLLAYYYCFIAIHKTVGIQALTPFLTPYSPHAVSDDSLLIRGKAKDLENQLSEPCDDEKCFKVL